MDDLREFEEIRLYFETCSKHQEIMAGEKAIYGHAEKLVPHAMKEWRKRHQQENNPLSFEICNPDEELPIQCGFGEKDAKACD